ncbi:hypothetical protein L3W54_24810, partial [Escherichia coli]|uniref:hypothetical protein n=1 Tax=Escherichia coli TaxID=562 RepID=UPI001F21400B
MNKRWEWIEHPPQGMARVLQMTTGHSADNDAAVITQTSGDNPCVTLIPALPAPSFRLSRAMA